MSKNMLVCLGLAVLSLSLSACGNTFNGAGKDVENMGEWMQDRF